MELRVKRLEEQVEKANDQLRSLGSDTNIIKGTMATGTDVHKAINEQTWKLITWTTGICLALLGGAFFIAQKIH